MITIYGYKKCSTVSKAVKFLKVNEIEFKHIDNVENPLSVSEIKNIHESSNQDIQKLFNTSGVVYRELNLKDKLAQMSLEEKYALLSTDGKLVKRPILVTDKAVLIGFKQEEYNNILGE